MKLSIRKPFKSSTLLLTALWSIAVMTLSSGCASGGFKVTRQYATFVNNQNIIIRILLYILGSFIFAITILIDVVVNNTLDFWNGRVSQGTYEFRDRDRTYVAQHRFKDGTKLRESHIQVYDLKGAKLQDVLVTELTTAKIDVYVDGLLKTTVSDINQVPQVSVFDAKGLLVNRYALPDTNHVAAQ